VFERSADVFRFATSAATGERFAAVRLDFLR